ncbi:MAG: phosphoribosylanthranilate isomerase [Rikenellaceae bacterium]
MIGGRLIKVCGMREAENILAVDALGVDMIGFIFYSRSPRFVAKLPAMMPKEAKRVGVFVDATLEDIGLAVKLYGLDFVQLHGGESPEEVVRVAALGVKTIKAFAVDAKFDFASTQPYAEVCDLLLFDTKCASCGGSGRQFDWSLLQRYRGRVPFLLSGGIGGDNIAQIEAFDHPQLAGYDLNSRFEVDKALKDVAQIDRFLSELKCRI